MNHRSFIEVYKQMPVAILLYPIVTIVVRSVICITLG